MIFYSHLSIGKITLEYQYNPLCQIFATIFPRGSTNQKRGKKKKNNSDNLLVARNDSNPMPQFMENDYDFPRSTLKKFHATFAICQRHIVKESKNVRPDTFGGSFRIYEAQRSRPVSAPCVLTKIKVGRLHGQRGEQRKTELLFAYRKKKRRERGKVVEWLAFRGNGALVQFR